MTFTKAIAALAIVAIVEPRISAQAGAPSDAEVTGRLAFIQHALDDGRKGADWWSYGWLAAYSAATVAQAAVYATTQDERQRDDMLIGSVTSALGAAGQIVFPLRGGRFAARLRTMPQGTPDERRAALAEAERFLRQAAAEEAFGRSWKTQAISTSVNLAAGLATWLHFNHSGRDGLATFAVGQLVSEGQIFSQPTKAVRNLSEYNRRTDFARVEPAREARPTWSLALSPTGFTIARAF